MTALTRNAPGTAAAPTLYPVAGAPPVALPRLRTALTFLVDGEAYGVDIGQAREIRCFETPTPVAGATPDRLGLINLRGTIVPVVDLRTRLGAATLPADGQTAVMVVQIVARLVGVVVDAFSDDGRHRPGATAPPAPKLGTSLAAARLLAIATLDERMVQLIDLGATVSGIGAAAPADTH